MAYLEGMEDRFGVIALGGNAILQKGQAASPANQMANLKIAIDNLTPAIRRYTSFALTHGNGPQVGNDLIRSYEAFRHAGLAELGLADSVANTQGRIGHWIIHEMKNHPRFRERPVASVLTHVYVEKNEFTPNEYVKRIGPWMPNTDKKREELNRRKIRFIESPDGKQIIRVVPSPRPYKIEEFKHIAHLLSKEIITICCGGGGIPVFDSHREDAGDNGSSNGFEQTEVVIDKDLASSLLAQGLLEVFDGAIVELVILMETRGLFRTQEFRDEGYIPSMTLDELEIFIENTPLEAGTILPKLEAIRDFLRTGGRQAFLGPLSAFGDIFTDESGVGTTFTNTPQMNLYDQ